MKKSFKHQARKRFGQHFLKDGDVLDKLLLAIRPQPTDHIVEIGPGRGALTQRLLPAVQQLDVIEIDRDLVMLLQDHFSTENNLNIHQGDVLNFDFTVLKTNDQLLRIIGNLPYNISTPLLFKLFSYRAIIKDMIFMLQKEVVERLTAPVSAPHYGRLSVMAHYFCDSYALFSVPPQSFSPPPKVESAVIYLTPRQQPPAVNDLQLFSDIVREAFSYRRKTLRNCLKKYLSVTQLQTLSIDPQQRPQELTVEDFVKISNMVSSSNQ